MLSQQEQELNVVRLRPGIIAVIIAVVTFVIGLIIYNLSDTMKKMHSDNNQQDVQVIHSVASDMDTSWYQNSTIQKSTLEENKNEKIKTYSQNNINLTAKTIEKPTSQLMDKQVATLPQNQKEVLEAMKAPITSNQLTNQQLGLEQSHDNQVNQSEMLPQSLGERDPNMQAEKSNFIVQNNQSGGDYLHSMLTNPITPYELQAGTIIPAVLITGINSDLPGEITAQVQSNVYDSIWGKYLLIPQGAKIHGVYDSKVAYGQKRVLSLWQRIIYPNGQSLNLEGMSGVDMSGYAGFKDEVNNHYWKLFSSVVLMSTLASGAQLSQPQQSSNPFAGPTVGQTIAQSLGTNIANVGTEVVSKDLNIQPTIEIRPGYEFNIEVKKDIVFIKPYSE